MGLFHSSTIGAVDTTSAIGTLSAVASSITSTVILAANADRNGATFTNASTATLYLALAASASNSAYTVKLLTDDYYELPFNYTGVISGIWSSANGNVAVTELT